LAIFPMVIAFAGIVVFKVAEVIAH
jgi:hypothetical protein